MLNKKFFGFFVFGLVVCASGAAFAADGEPLGDAVKQWMAVAAAFGMALGTVGGAYGQAKAVAAALEGMARNPSAAGKIQTPMIIGLALIESLVLFTFVVTFVGLALKI